VEVFPPTQYVCHVNRSTKGYIKDRLKLCDLSATAQDLYLRDTGGRLTLTKMLALHEYTRGGKENRGVYGALPIKSDSAASCTVWCTVQSTGPNGDAHHSLVGDECSAGSDFMGKAGEIARTW